MRRVPAVVISSLVLAILLAACRGSAGAAVELPGGADLKPKGEVLPGVPVLRVVDGDTLHVLVNGRDVTVRMIGLNTPETVKPNSPIECFGPAASQFAKRALTDQRVTLELDRSQGRTDKYGRMLAYVWLARSGGGLRLFNLAEIAGGYAYERQYGPTPYAWRNQFRAAERSAQAAGAGLWAACPN
jgi:micrococcal nuclease